MCVYVCSVYVSVCMYVCVCMYVLYAFDLLWNIFFSQDSKKEDAD